MRCLSVLLVLVAGTAALAAPAPARLVAASENGTWLIDCANDKPRLRVGHDAGAVVDDILAASPGGDAFVYVLRKRVSLARPGHGPDIRLAGAVASLGVAFDAEGKRLVYARPQGKAVVRDVESGTETVIDAGPGRLRELSIDPTGHWLTLHVQGPGTSYVKTGDERHPACWGGRSGDVVSAIGTPPEARLVPAAGGRARVVPDLVATLGADLLRRTADGALVLEDASGAVRPFVPAPCGARLLAVGVETAATRAVVACADGAVVTYDRAGAHPSPARVKPPEEDRLDPPSRHVLVEGRDANAIIVDLTTGARRDTGVAQDIVAARGPRTLVERGESLVLLDGDGERVLGAIDRYPTVLRAGDLVYVAPLVVDLASGTLVGTAPPSATILAVSRRGDLLAQVGSDLTWVKPIGP